VREEIGDYPVREHELREEPDDGEIKLSVNNILYLLEPFHMTCGHTSRKIVPDDNAIVIYCSDKKCDFMVKLW
jgi:hypothetical protein